MRTTTSSTVETRTLKALTILQPWASAVIRPRGYPFKDRFKSVENRCWFTSYRGPLVIHAGRSRERVTPELVALIDRLLPGWAADVDKLRYGAILGVVDLVDCIDADSPAGRELLATNPWCDPPRDGVDGYYWVLQSPRSLDQPIVYSGKQGLWTIDGAKEPRTFERLVQLCR